MVDILRMLALDLSIDPGHEGLGKTYDDIQRGPEFMRHIREEIRFRHTGALRNQLCIFKFTGPPSDSFFEGFDYSYIVDDRSCMVYKYLDHLHGLRIKTRRVITV